MSVNKASAQWHGSIKEGSGTLTAATGAFTGEYSFKGRFEGAPAQTNPEELIGLALAGCFTMALSGKLGEKGFTPQELNTTASVTLDKNATGFVITQIALEVRGTVPDIREEEFQAAVKDAKQNCPVSKALAGVEITASATLTQ